MGSNSATAVPVEHPVVAPPQPPLLPEPPAIASDSAGVARLTLLRRLTLWLA